MAEHSKDTGHRPFLTEIESAEVFLSYSDRPVNGVLILPVENPASRDSLRILTILQHPANTWGNVGSASRGLVLGSETNCFVLDK